MMLNRLLNLRFLLHQLLESPRWDGKIFFEVQVYERNFFLHIKLPDFGELHDSVYVIKVHGSESIFMHKFYACMEWFWA